jgi:hypothetical protein
MHRCGSCVRPELAQIRTDPRVLMPTAGCQSRRWQLLQTVSPRETLLQPGVQMNGSIQPRVSLFREHRLWPVLRARRNDIRLPWLRPFRSEESTGRCSSLGGWSRASARESKDLKRRIPSGSSKNTPPESDWRGPYSLSTVPGLFRVLIEGDLRRYCAKYRATTMPPVWPPGIWAFLRDVPTTTILPSFWRARP